MTIGSSPLKRRAVIRGLLAAGAFGATSRFWTGCTPAPPQSQTTPTATSAKTLTIGYIYVGPKDDYGYNQSHAEGEAAVAKVNGVKTVDQASVPETVEVQEVMRNMIKENGVQVLFPASYGYYDPHILKMAVEFPDVQFFPSRCAV